MTIGALVSTHDHHHQYRSARWSRSRRPSQSPARTPPDFSVGLPTLDIARIGRERRRSTVSFQPTSPRAEERAAHHQQRKRRLARGDAFRRVGLPGDQRSPGCCREARSACRTSQTADRQRRCRALCVLDRERDAAGWPDAGALAAWCRARRLRPARSPSRCRPRRPTAAVGIASYTVAIAPSTLTASPTLVNFGSVAVGGAGTRTVTLTNNSAVADHAVRRSRSRAPTPTSSR